MRFCVFIFVGIYLTNPAQSQTLAFPTAEGYGKYVTGGRGGQVIHVTNLEDKDRFGGTIQGSLRAALEASKSGPTTIVFDTSGVITLSSELRFQRDNVTIAGQTAPGDGICIKGASVNLGSSKNLIIRHLRFRVGKTDADSYIDGACLNIENAGNFIVDHCSFSWSAEENIGMYNNDSYTVQWCISAEALYNAGHPKGARSYGAVIGGKRATFHHNLLAHNVSRSPRFGTTDKNDSHVTIEYVNNVNFNWGRQNACYGGENEIGAAGTVEINFMNNYYRPGPAYPGTSRTNFVRPSYEVGLQGTYYSKWHVSGNYIEGSANQSLNSDNWNGVDLEEYQDNVPSVTAADLKAAKHVVPYPIQMETASQAFQSVKNKSGAFPRDQMDLRIMDELDGGTASAISSFGAYKVSGIVDKPSDSGGLPEYIAYNFLVDSDSDGMPDYWEVANGLNVTNPSDRNNLTQAGYTFLEAYLNGIVGEYLDDVSYPEPDYTDAIEKQKIILDQEELVVEEGGNTNLIKVRLATIPRGQVTLKFTPSDETRISISPSTITFGRENAMVDQLVTISTPDDSAFKGDLTGSVTVSVDGQSMDYLTVLSQEIAISVLENDVPLVVNGRFLNVFPNPTNNLLTLSSSGVIRSASVMNISGQVVKSFDGSSESIRFDLTKDPSGVYFIRVNHGINEEVVRVIKK